MTRKAVDWAVDLLVIGSAILFLVLLGSFVLNAAIGRLGLDPTAFLDFLEAILVAGFAAWVGYRRGKAAE